jgi:hypothetical protein
MSGPRLADIVRQQSLLLEDLLAGAAFEIVDEDPEVCTLRTSWVEVVLAYDWRDQWVTALLKPLTVPDDMTDSYPDHLWLKFCGIETGEHRKSALDERQVIDAFNLIRPIVELFKGDRAARDALWFVRGYSHAYTDWASGSWD